jgi:hypothetical protein
VGARSVVPIACSLPRLAFTLPPADHRNQAVNHIFVWSGQSYCFILLPRSENRAERVCVARPSPARRFPVPRFTTSNNEEFRAFTAQPYAPKLLTLNAFSLSRRQTRSLEVEDTGFSLTRFAEFSVSVTPMFPVELELKGGLSGGHL